MKTFDAAYNWRKDETVPEEARAKAMAAVSSGGNLPTVPLEKDIIAMVGRAIMIERDRIQQIIDAEREWGDCHPDDIGERLWSGDGPRLIGGWNAKYTDDDDVLIPEDYVYVPPKL